MACASAGEIFDQGLGTTRDVKRALAFFDRGCRLGNSESCVRTHPGHVADAAARERAEFQAECDQSLGVGCHNLAVLYLEGRGGEKNSARALELFERSCTLGYPPACHELGVMALGDHGRRGRERAETYLTRACDGSWPEACQRLGPLLWSKRTHTDDDRAVAAWEKACGAGVAVSCQALAEVLRRGTRIEMDRAKADALSVRACELGLRAACARGGRLRAAKGPGTAPPPASARPL